MKSSILGDPFPDRCYGCETLDSGVSGRNPHIPKGYGDEPVRAYMHIFEDDFDEGQCLSWIGQANVLPEKSPPPAGVDGANGETRTLTPCGAGT